MGVIIIIEFDHRRICHANPFPGRNRDISPDNDSNIVLQGSFPTRLSSVDLVPIKFLGILLESLVSFSKYILDPCPFSADFKVCERSTDKQAGDAILGTRF